jgi:hypothetical protein
MLQKASPYGPKIRSKPIEGQIHKYKQQGDETLMHGLPGPKSLTRVTELRGKRK